MTTIIMDTRLIIIAIETPIKDPSSGPSIFDREREFAIIVLCESVGKIVMAVEISMVVD